MFKFYLSDFFKILVVTLIIAFTSSQSEAKEEAQHIASNFTLENLDGKEVSLLQFRGKYLLINFWATWCGPCKIEMPSLEKLYQQFKSDNFDMLGISNDMFGGRVVRPYIKAEKITFQMLLDQRMIVSRQYGIVSLPTTILIDPKGIIIGVLQGAEDWSDPETLQYFKKLLKKS
jgi:peroxiredoxin